VRERDGGGHNSHEQGADFEIEESLGEGAGGGGGVAHARQPGGLPVPAPPLQAAGGRPHPCDPWGGGRAGPRGAAKKMAGPTRCTGAETQGERGGCPGELPALVDDDGDDEVDGDEHVQPAEPQVVRLARVAHAPERGDRGWRGTREDEGGTRGGDQLVCLEQRPLVGGISTKPVGRRIPPTSGKLFCGKKDCPPRCASGRLGSLLRNFDHRPLLALQPQW